MTAPDEGRREQRPLIHPARLVRHRALRPFAMGWFAGFAVIGIFGVNGIPTVAVEESTGAAHRSTSM